MRSIILPVTLSFSLGLSACQQLPVAQDVQQAQQLTRIRGTVSWPVAQPKIQIQAEIADIQQQATVSLLYPSDHPTQPNRTLATGLTDANGQFMINPDSSFTPSVGSIFVLEASKRVHGTGEDLLSLRTLLRWDGNSWTSITGHSVNLNALTAAITLMSHYDDSFSSQDTMGTVINSAIPELLGTASAADIASVQNLVILALHENQDPTHHIYHDGSYYQRLTSPQPQPTPVPTAPPVDPTPDPYGNEYLGFLNMTAMDAPNGLDVKNGYAYSGHYKLTSRFLRSDRPDRLLRTLNIATGQLVDTEVSSFNPSSTPVRIAGVAVNAALVWVALDGYDDDSRNLYQFNLSGQRLNRYQVGPSGTIIHDIAVDASSGTLYIASRTTNSIIKYNPVNPEGTQLNFSGDIHIDPLGLAVDNDGHVYTFDTISHQVLKFSKDNGSKLLAFGPAGTQGNGEHYTAVSDVAVDPRNGEIYVVGNASGTVKVFRYTAQGHFIRSFSAPDLIDPRKMTVDADGKVYIVDNSKGGILVFNPGLASPPPPIHGNTLLGFLSTPQMTDINGLAMAGGQAYISYYRAGGAFSSNSLSVRRFALANGSTAETTVWGQFFGDPQVRLSGVAAHSNNGEFWTVSNDLPSVKNGEDSAYNLYHFNSSGERIQRYRVGNQGIVLNDVAVDSSSGVVYMISPSTQSLIRFNPSNLSETNMLFSGAQALNPVGLGLDANGDIYVSDAASRRVIKYAKADGSKILEIGASQNFNALGDVAVDPRNGDIYVLANAGSGMQIYRFNGQGHFIQSISHPNLIQPQKMAIGSDGHVHVVEGSQKSVMTFDAGQ